MIKAEDILNKTEADAVGILKKEKISYRISSVDGNYFLLTSDFRPERWNLAINGGIVTYVVFG